MSLTKRALAELFGTFWLVLGGCGSAVLAAGIPELGLGYLGVSFAFGLTVVTMAYAIGHISGCHLNPAVSIGLVAGGRFKAAELPHYIIAQVLGGILAAAMIWCIASGQDGHTLGGFAANGYGEASPHGYALHAAFACEVVMTAVFLFIIMGTTDKSASPAMAGLAIGLTLALIHMISIPVTNTSVNPARSTSQAVFAGGIYLQQLWLFWVAPILGGVIGAKVYNFVSKP